MTDRPILFSAPMVRALLAGWKTQTRRLLKPQPAVFTPNIIDIAPPTFDADEGGWGQWRTDWSTPSPDMPMGQPEREVWVPLNGVRWTVGDKLWVRETLWQVSRYPGTLPSGEPEPLSSCWGSKILFAADGDPPNTPNRHYPTGLRNGRFAAPDPYASWHKRPSIFMPKAASRITLTVTDVRVQRLQDISEDDARAEGLSEISKDDGRTWKFGIPDRDGYPGKDNDSWPWHEWDVDPRKAYLRLWDKINGKGAAEANPYVIALTLTVEQKNIDG